MALDFDRPITLRAADQADDTESLLIDLAAALRTLNAEHTYCLALVADTSIDVGLRIYRAEANIKTAQETGARCQRAVERLTRSLRAAGRL